MELVFWLLIGTIAWTYAGYPCLLLLLSCVRTRTFHRSPIQPSVTVIISAYNEEGHIREKLLNTLSLDYPRDKLEIIVASDCSTDRTHAITEEFRRHGVKLVALAERRGKTAAQNAAAEVARGEILVFTDATTRFPPDTLRRLLEGFADPRVGCVGAELEYVTEGETAIGKGGSMYWRYEKMVKELEGRVNSLIGVSGCLYAVRTSLYTPIDADLISDFIVASETFAKGYVTIYGRGVVSHEKTHQDTSLEFEMRVRIIVRTLHALVRQLRMLNPFRYGFFAFQLFSHKVMRYLVPECLIGAFFISLALALQGGPRATCYGWLFGVQLAVYITAALQWTLLRFNTRVRALYLPFYFVHANAASLWALVVYLRGERKITWTTVR